MRKGNPLPGFCQLHRSLSSLLGPFSLQRADLDHVAAQSFPKLHQVNIVPVLANQVNHIHCHHNRIAQFQKLRCQVEVSFDVGSVDDIQNRIRMLLNQICTRYHFLRGVWRQGIDSRQILENHMPIPFQGAFLLFNRNTGPVSHILIGPCQRIEQRCLSAVWISRQSDFD